MERAPHTVNPGAPHLPGRGGGRPVGPSAGASVRSPSPGSASQGAASGTTSPPPSRFAVFRLAEKLNVLEQREGQLRGEDGGVAADRESPRSLGSAPALLVAPPASFLICKSGTLAALGLLLT